MGPDDRQRVSTHVVSALINQLATPVAGSERLKPYGFPASAVDLGVLQTVLNTGLGHFTMDQVRERWDDDVKNWIISAIRTWVQRCKEMHLDVADNGVHVSMQTQDDHGYYSYEFDVFPGRKRAELP